MRTRRTMRRLAGSAGHDAESRRSCFSPSAVWSRRTWGRRDLRSNMSASSSETPRPTLPPSTCGTSRRTATWPEAPTSPIPKELLRGSSPTSPSFRTATTGSTSTSTSTRPTPRLPTERLGQESAKPTPRGGWGGAPRLPDTTVTTLVHGMVAVRYKGRLRLGAEAPRSTYRQPRADTQARRRLSPQRPAPSAR
jgi:hypothetical protein